jgi:flagellar basal body rod protein FlgC
LLLEEHENQEKRADARAALIASILANVNRDRKKRKKPFTLEDFMLTGKKKEPKKKQSIEEMIEMTKILNAAFGGKVVKKDGSS